MIVRTNCSTTAISLSFAALITLSALPVSRPVLGQGAGQQSPMGRQAVLPGPSDDLLAKLESTYKDIHANPELSMQERRTAGIAANWLREQGYEVTEGVGGTGARTGEGRKRAQERGVRFGRPTALTSHQRHEALQRLANGEAHADVARSFNVSPATVSRLQA